MSTPTPIEMEEQIEELWKQLKIRQMVEALGMTKDRWIEEAIRGPEKHFLRCENCMKWKCQAIKSLEKRYPIIIKFWYKFGTNCPSFNAKSDAI